MVCVFGVRHLSPGCAGQLLRLLHQRRPSCVLIEAPSDTRLIWRDILESSSYPPLAIIAEGVGAPDSGLRYVFTEYSPEYQAMLWAKSNNCVFEFIDLPIGQLLGSLSSNRTNMLSFTPFEDTWEQTFEQDIWDLDEFMQAINELGSELRDSLAPEQAEFEHLRESYMARNISKAIREGYSPDEIVVVVGAVHAAQLSHDYDALSGDAPDELPSIDHRTVVVPYSNEKIYLEGTVGPGAVAPGFYDFLWKERWIAKAPHIAESYVMQFVRYKQNQGIMISQKEITDTIILAQALSELNGGYPVRSDFDDAFRTILGCSPSLDYQIGSKVGYIFELSGKMPIQQNFMAEVDRLNLRRYTSVVSRTLGLDLRKRTSSQKKKSTGLDYERSQFLHRLAILGLPFARPLELPQDTADYREQWTMSWSEDVEAELIECGLRGDSIGSAAEHRLNELLRVDNSVERALYVLQTSDRAGLERVMQSALGELQARTSILTDVTVIMKIAHGVSVLLRRYERMDEQSYTKNTKVNQAQKTTERAQSSTIYDPSIKKNYSIWSHRLSEMLCELFVRGGLALETACRYEELYSRAVADAIDKLDAIAITHTEVHHEVFISTLLKISSLRECNGYISGYACGLLVERKVLDTSALGVKIAQQMSLGVEFTQLAGWLEGFMHRDRYTLLSKLNIWKLLSKMVATQSEDHFRRCMVGLRRALQPFSPQEKRSLVENLIEAGPDGQGLQAEDIRRWRLIFGSSVQKELSRLAGDELKLTARELRVDDVLSYIYDSRGGQTQKNIRSGIQKSKGKLKNLDVLGALHDWLAQDVLSLIIQDVFLETRNFLFLLKENQFTSFPTTTSLIQYVLSTPIHKDTHLIVDKILRQGASNLLEKYIPILEQAVDLFTNSKSLSAKKTIILCFDNSIGSISSMVHGLVFCLVVSRMYEVNIEILIHNESISLTKTKAVFHKKSEDFEIMPLTEDRTSLVDVVLRCLSQISWEDSADGSNYIEQVDNLLKNSPNAYVLLALGLESGWVDDWTRCRRKWLRLGVQCIHISSFSGSIPIPADRLQRMLDGCGLPSIHCPPHRFAALIERACSGVEPFQLSYAVSG